MRVGYIGWTYFVMFGCSWTVMYLNKHQWRSVLYLIRSSNNLLISSFQPAYPLCDLLCICMNEDRCVYWRVHSLMFPVQTPPRSNLRGPHAICIPAWAWTVQYCSVVEYNGALISWPQPVPVVLVSPWVAPLFSSLATICAIASLSSVARHCYAVFSGNITNPPLCLICW